MTMARGVVSALAGVGRMRDVIASITETATHSGTPTQWSTQRCRLMFTGSNPARPVSAKLQRKFGKAAGIKRVAHFLHQIQVIVQVVNA